MPPPNFSGEREDSSSRHIGATGGLARDGEDAFNLEAELSAIENDPDIGLEVIRKKGVVEGEHGRLHPEQVQDTDKLDDPVEQRFKRVYQRCFAYYRKRVRKIREKLEAAVHIPAFTSRSEGQEWISPHIVDAENDMKNVIAKHKAPIQEGRDRVWGSEDRHDDFVQTHGISAENRDDLLDKIGGKPWNPEKEQKTRRDALSILFLMVFIESVLNGMAFTVSGGAALESWGLAILISFVNILCLGFVIWQAWRYLKCAEHGTGHWVARAFMVLFCLIALLSNLFAAHYRDAVESGEDASKEALERFFTQFLNLDGFLSYMFLVMGLIFVYFAIRKWEALIPGYPGYRAILIEEEEESWIQVGLIAKAKKELEDINIRYENLMTTGIRDAYADIKLLPRRLTEECDDWGGVYPEVTDRCAHVLGEYREGLLEGWEKHPVQLSPPERWREKWTSDWEKKEMPGYDEIVYSVSTEEEVHELQEEEKRQKNERLGPLYRFYLAMVDDLADLNRK